MYTILLLVLSVAFIILATTRLRLHPFLALIVVAIAFGLASGMPLSLVASSLNEGFGGTIGRIGIIIIAGTIIGTFLEKSGGALMLAERLLKLTGQKNVPLTMNLIGYVISIPVFADSGFVMLSPLNRALTKKAGLSLAVTAGALALGLTASHNLVPPTPGPIAAAGLLQADLGLVLSIGIPVSLVASLAGWLFAKRFASRFWIDPNPQITEAELQSQTVNAPSWYKSVIPILLPIMLIVLKSLADLPGSALGQGQMGAIIKFIGEPVIALLLGVALALTLPKTLNKEMLSSSGWVGAALIDASIIILITGAGGSFGKMLQNAGLAKTIGDLMSGINIGILLPVLLAAAIKTAQGSSTVALITTASIMAPLAPTLGFDGPVAKALLVLAIGAGSSIVSHANDSFFWIMTQMSSMDVKTGYKIQSLGSFVIGSTAAVMVWLASLILI
ncbi:MAG TPA: GntP family permease [Chitinophagaceae bacterium]|nr:GntP family permease [Chitinophagaceae bacterium]